MIIKLRIFFGLVIGLMLVAAFVVSQPTHANPSTFVRAQTATATTSPIYFAVTATSTLTINSNANVAFDSAVLNFCLNASSTATVLNIGREYSQDGNTWYQDNLSDRATTTPNVSIGTAWSYQYSYASTTPGGATGGITQNAGCKSVIMPTPTKYTRVFFSLAPGSTNGSIYAEIVGKQQAP